MNIAVLGGPNGLGQELVQRECVPVRANILDIDAMRAELHKIRPEVVINCTEVSTERSLDDCDHTNFINNRGPANLLRAFPGRVIHISTDHIFDGKRGNYLEEDDPNPINYYGITKWAGEIHCGILGEGRCCIVRTSGLYGGHSKNGLFGSILQILKDGNAPLFAPVSHRNNPTYIPHLVDVLMELCRRVDLPPILHICGTDTVSPFEFAREVARMWHLFPMVVPSDMYLEWSKIKHPKNSSLNTEQAKKLGLPLHSLFKGLCDYNAADTSA